MIHINQVPIKNIKPGMKFIFNVTGHMGIIHGFTQDRDCVELVFEKLDSLPKFCSYYFSLTKDNKGNAFINNFDFSFILDQNGNIVIQQHLDDHNIKILWKSYDGWIEFLKNNYNCDDQYTTIYN